MPRLFLPRNTETHLARGWPRQREGVHELGGAPHADAHTRQGEPELVHGREGPAAQYLCPPQHCPHTAVLLRRRGW
jgi:hypothetical protein